MAENELNDQESCEQGMEDVNTTARKDNCPNCPSGTRYEDGKCIFHTRQWKKESAGFIKSKDGVTSADQTLVANIENTTQSFIAQFNEKFRQIIEVTLKLDPENAQTLECKNFIFPALTKSEWRDLWTFDSPDNDAMLCGLGKGRTMPIGVKFSHCTFYGDILFDHSNFERNFIMTDCTVMGTSIFNKTSIVGNALFYRTLFNQTAYFVGAEFGIKNTTSYEEGLETETNFQHCVFMGQESQLAPKSLYNTVEFSSHEFAIDSRPVYGQYGGAAFFDHAHFNNGRTEFHNTSFLGDASFCKASFNKTPEEGGSCVFSQAIFKGNIAFEGGHFKNGGEFDNATFFGTVNLQQVELKNKLYLTYSNFHQETVLSISCGNDANVLLNFTGSSIHHHLRISCPEDKSDWIPIIYLHELKLFGEALVFFEDINLSRTSFWLSNFWLNESRIFFNRVQWPKKSSQKVIRDDFLSNPDSEVFNEKYISANEMQETDHEESPIKQDCISTSNLIELEQQYRQIRLAYETRGAYTEAGDFFAGEMRARGERLKLALKPKRQSTLLHWVSDKSQQLIKSLRSTVDWAGNAIFFLMHWLYGLFGRWGESPARVVFWLALFMLGLLPLWLLASGGFAVHGKPQEFDFLCWSSCEFDYSYYQNAVNYIMQSMTLRFPDSFSTTGFWASLPAVFARVLGPALITIWGISLRRRFRRSSGE